LEALAARGLEGSHRDLEAVDHLAGRGLVVVALLVAAEVWNWCRHGVPPLGIDWCMIFQTNHLPGSDFAGL